MRFQSVFFVLLLSLGVFGGRPAAAQVVINAQIGRPYYAPRPYYGPRYYYPPVAPVVVAPPPPVVVYPPPVYYAPRPRVYYAPPRPHYHGRGYGRRW
ncbi:MAG TPA: hypothetical protein VFO93_02750 [Hymenobacter sp.]|uniref:hypothetical protein n=1 Tax=Hymenobacter sp. TaxID=1898978 RepID=UPI002D7E569E|nr:hypothetical protein [Hymenobacter sp.]HET9502434.1 hypothetical protein [Hymenobacter sp.]